MAERLLGGHPASAWVYGILGQALSVARDHKVTALEMALGMAAVLAEWERGGALKDEQGRPMTLEQLVAKAREGREECDKVGATMRRIGSLKGPRDV